MKMANKNKSATSNKVCSTATFPDFDQLGLPQLPGIPEITLCLHFPWTEGWYSHWTEFNKKIKDFHQTMIDFNWKILEWYSIKSKQLERFGTPHPYIAGTVVTGGRITIVYANAISADNDVFSEIRKCLPNAIKEQIKQLEKYYFDYFSKPNIFLLSPKQKGYKLCLVGKVFIFNNEKAIVIDYDKEPEKAIYRDCLKFSLYHRNERINVTEAYGRVYGGLKYSFIIGGVGGLVVSLLTGYFGRHPIYPRRIPEQNILWLAVKRCISSSFMYTLIERVLLLKFSQPQKYLLSGSAGVICGAFLGFCDDCDTDTIYCGAAEYGVFAFLSNAFLRNLDSKRIVGSSNAINGNG